MSKVKNHKGENVVDIGFLDDDLCALIQEYMPLGWQSENGKLFFDDEEIVEEFNEAVAILTKLIRGVQQ